MSYLSEYRICLVNTLRMAPRAASAAPLVAPCTPAAGTAADGSLFSPSASLSSFLRPVPLTGDRWSPCMPAAALWRRPPPLGLPCTSRSVARAVSPRRGAWFGPQGCAAGSVSLRGGAAGPPLSTFYPCFVTMRSLCGRPMADCGRTPARLDRLSLGALVRCAVPLGSRPLYGPAIGATYRGRGGLSNLSRCCCALLRGLLSAFADLDSCTALE